MVTKKPILKYNGYHDSSGAVLIIVLVFTTMIAMLANMGMESGILQLKMVNNLKAFLNTKSQAENELVSIEKKLANDFQFELPSHVKLLQFVPDTLHFGENEGSNYYRIEINKSNADGSNYQLISTFSVRKEAPENLSPDHFFRLNSGEWAEIFVNSDFGTKKTSLTFLNLHTQNIIKQIIIPKDHISSIVAVDSNGKGYSDAVYFGDDEGNLWKINMQNWTCQQHQLGLFGGIIAKPIVGRHPSGNGVLIYLLTQIKLNKQQIIHVFSDNQNVIKPFYTIEEEPSLGQPILRQGYLLAVDKLYALNIYDAFTGALIKKEKMQYFNEGGSSVGDIDVLRVTIEKPLENQPLVVVNTNKGVFFCRTEIEFGRLGRRTWKTRNH